MPSTSGSVASVNRIDFPLCTRSSWTSGRSASWKYHGYFVAGHEPKPLLPGVYGSSWQAPKKLGKAESGVRVSSPRSRRKPCASSTDRSARSGVSLQR